MAVTLPPIVTITGIVYRVTDRVYDGKPSKRFDVKTPDAGLIRVKVDPERDSMPLPTIGEEVTVVAEVTEYAVDGKHGVTFTRLADLVAA